MIIEIHIQVLVPSYGSPVAIHFYYKRVDGYITVFDTDVDRDTVDQISLFVLEEKFFRYFGKSFTVEKDEAITFNMDSRS